MKILPGGQPGPSVSGADRWALWYILPSLPPRQYGGQPRGQGGGASSLGCRFSSGRCQTSSSSIPSRRISLRRVSGCSTGKSLQLLHYITLHSSYLADTFIQSNLQLTRLRGLRAWLKGPTAALILLATLGLEPLTFQVPVKHLSL